jgi:alpha-ketoglutarate-dependent taurine dioxygenase
MQNYVIDRIDSEPSRIPIRVSEEDGCILELFSNEKPLPLVIRPKVGNLDICEWASRHKDLIELLVLKYGAIIFRGHSINSASDFEALVRSISVEPLEYRERSSPRSDVGNRIYTSTDHPHDQSIFPHNEHSYSKNIPLRLYFFCLNPAQQGGETPIADTRRILNRIRQKTRERFIEKKWMYVRNYNDGLGLTWQTAFQTEDKAVVESYCRKNNVEFEWKAGSRLRTRQIRPAVARHPRTGEEVWFNHAIFFHVTTLEETLCEALLASFEEQDLPNNTFYGDSSPIEPDVLDEVRDAYLQECVAFGWQRGDVLLVDNMLTAHARAPYVGDRQVLVAMAEPYTRSDI